MLQVILRDIRIQGEHGVFKDEKHWGTTFRVGLKIDLKEDPPFNTLDETVDYSKVYEIVRSLFAEQEYLLENLAQKIFQALINQFPQILAIEISILKEDPPIPAFDGEVGIIFKKSVE